MSSKTPCVYILANRKRGALYVGMTALLVADRMDQHLETETVSFVRKYGLDRLVFVEYFPTIIEAAASERKIKRWRREWKYVLIEKTNPEWQCLKKHL